MLDLKSAKLPSEIIVDGSFFNIHTDFRFWLIFVDKFKNQNLAFEDFDFVYSGAKPTDKKKGFEELLKFANPPTVLPRDIGGGKNIKVIDYNLDADYIYSAFMEQYHIDLFDENLRLHWWKFKALLNGLKDTKLNEIMGYRCYDENDKDDYKKTMIKSRQMWEIRNEPTLTDEEKRLEAEFEKKANPK